MLNLAALTRWAGSVRSRSLLATTVLFAVLAGTNGWAQPAPTPTLPELRARAEKDDLEAQNTLGNAYANALLGLRQDHVEALKWYRLAADKGFAPAQFNLALAYELGRGVPADEREAFKYYRLSAEQGFATALFNVGNMYAAGRGVGQDLFESVIWYRQAADKGLVEAQFNLGLAYEAGRGVRQDENQAARWYRQAAERGYPLALYNLGLLFEDGRGVAKDEAAAAGLYRAAAELGIASAQNNYGLMLLEGRGGLAKDPAEAYVWLSLAVDHGVAPTARDTVANTLTAAQLTAATRLLDDRRAGKVPTTSPLIGPVKANPAGPTRTGEATASLARQIAPPPSTSAPSAADVARYQAEIAALTSRLEQTSGALNRLQQAHTRLRQENQAAAKNRQDEPATIKSRFPVQESDPEVIIAGLKRDNASLNDEVKRASRELLWLKQQKLESERAAPESGASNGSALRTAQGEITRLNTELEQMRSAAPVPPAATTSDEVVQLNNRVRELTAQLRLAQTRNLPKGEGSPALVQLQQQVQLLQGEKADLEKWTQVLERSLREKTAQPEVTGSTASDLPQKLAQAQQQLTTSTAALEAQLQRGQKLGAENRELADRARRAEESLAAQIATRPDPDGIARLQRQVVELQQTILKQSLEKEALANVLAEEQANDRQTKPRIAALERELRDAQATAKRVHNQSTVPAPELIEANLTIEKLTASVAELTGLNDRLEQDLVTARQATASALAARPSTNRIESSPQSARVKELENQLEEERGSSAREVATLAAQLQRARESSRSLTSTNRELTAERDALESRLASTRPQTTSAPVAPAENAALREQLAQAQRELAARQKSMDDLTQELATSRQTAALAAAPSSPGAETAQLNLRLEQEREDMRRLVDSYRADIARLTQSLRTAEQQRTQVERSGQQNFDATTTQLRRELENTRATQSRQAEAFATQDRERAAIITQLRTENSALTARLSQTQGTLDQIAGSLRLAIPAANISSSGAAPIRPTPALPAASRFHSVEQGDSLSRISLRYYGTANRWQEIFQANSDVLQGSSTLRVGQQLRIP